MYIYIYIYFSSLSSLDSCRVSIYLPMVVELPAAMLACARIGAVHSVVFGGFSAESLAGRIVDAQSSVVITADGVMRGGKPVQLKGITDKVGRAQNFLTEGKTQNNDTNKKKRVLGSDFFVWFCCFLVVGKGEKVKKSRGDP